MATQVNITSLLIRGDYATALGLTMAEMDYALNQLSAAIKAEADARVAALAAREYLKDREAALLSGGEIMGKNVAERDANLRIMLRDEYAEALDMERDLVQASAMTETLKYKYRMTRTVNASALGMMAYFTGRDDDE